MTTPEGIVAKIQRARLHLRELDDAVEDFIDGQPFRIDLEEAPDTGDYIAQFVARGRVLEEPPAVEWGVLAGEVVHGARSALDNLVWALSELNWGAGKPPPQKRDWIRVSFPVFKTAASWPNHVVKLWAVKPALVSKFEALQPYQPSNEYREAIALLEELWNVDKHRVVPIVSAFVDPMPKWFMSPTKGNVLMTGDFVPFEDGAEVMRFGVIENYSEGEPKITFGVEASFGVAFEQHPGRDARHVLQDALGAVTAILGAFESEFV